MKCTKAVTPKPVFQEVTVAITFQSQAEVDMIHTMANELTTAHIGRFSIDKRGDLVRMTEAISEALEK